MEQDNRILFFQNMVSCCHNLYLWCYDCAFHLISTNCPEPEAIQNLFLISSQQSDFYSEIAKSDTPLLLASQKDMIWLAIPLLEDGELIRTYILGPLFTDDISAKDIGAQLAQHGMTPALQKKVMEFLHSLPIVAWNRMLEYGIMLFYCINERKIGVSDLRFCKTNHAGPHKSNFEQPNVHGTYQVEQEMLRMVREGDLNLHAHINKMSVTGNMGKLSNGDTLRQMKNAVLVCTTLISRAAIEGGLSPELSFTLTDRYFQSVEACTTISDLSQITYTMQEDFVQRVHRCRYAKLSQPIQTCCDYIALHLEEEISISLLARQTGYSEYYLSKKFKKEMGCTPAEYIRKTRLERAAFLLRATQEDIQDISGRLLFGTHSYFSDSFKKQYGVSPSEYRNNKKEGESSL